MNGGQFADSQEAVAAEQQQRGVAQTEALPSSAASLAAATATSRFRPSTWPRPRGVLALQPPERSAGGRGRAGLSARRTGGGAMAAARIESDDGASPRSASAVRKAATVSSSAARSPRKAAKRSTARP